MMTTLCRSLLGSLLVLSVSACGGMEDGDIQETQQKEVSGYSSTISVFEFVDVFTKAPISGVTVNADMTSTSPPEYSVTEIVPNPTGADGFSEVVIRCILGGAADYMCTKWPVFQLWASHPSYAQLYRAAYSTGAHKELTWPVHMSYQQFELVPACQDYTPCHGYRCNTTLGKCRTACGGSANIKCATGYQCVNGACVL